MVEVFLAAVFSVVFIGWGLIIREVVEVTRKTSKPKYDLEDLEYWHYFYGQGCYTGKCHHRSITRQDLSITKQCEDVDRRTSGNRWKELRELKSILTDLADNNDSVLNTVGEGIDDQIGNRHRRL